ncbi:MAG: hypothetical protein PVI20_20215 [Desulfobacteraceae bacterium]|jgi:hypothetical protein
MRNHSIPHYVIAVLCLFALCSVTSTGFGAPSFRIEPMGVRIVASEYGTDTDSLRPFNWSKGSSLACLLLLPEGGIIQFDVSKSKIEKFQDNMGTNLLSEDTSWRPVFGPLYEISTDRKAILFDLDSENVPKKGATSIRASGALAIKVATATKTVKHDNVALKAGTKFKVGDITFTVSKAGKPDWGDAALQVRLSTHQDPAAVLSIQFFGSDGTVIESRNTASSSMVGMDSDATYEEAYALSKHAEQVAIVATYWVDIKELIIPFSIEATLGL